MRELEMAKWVVPKEVTYTTAKGRYYDFNVLFCRLADEPRRGGPGMLSVTNLSFQPPLY